MAKGRSAILGRDAELTELDDALASVTSHRHTLAVVRGSRGIGKTALLTAAADRWRRDRVTVLTIPFSTPLPSWDLFGVTATITALRNHFEQLADVGLAESIDAVSRMNTPETYGSARLRSALLVRLATIFASIHRQHGRLVVIADDLDAVPNPMLAIAPACLPGCLVIAICRDNGHFALTPVQLGQLADQLIDLGPLPDDAPSSLIAQRLGVVADASLHTTLAHALGPLICDPGTLLSAVDCLNRDGRIVTIHGQACLSDSRPISLPVESDLLDQVRLLADPGRDLMVLAATSHTLSIESLPALAAISGTELRTYGHAVDVLVAVGALVSDENGRLSCACPALAESVLASVPAVAGALHEKLGERLLLLGGRNADIADHFTAAGRQAHPSLELGLMLVDEARSATEDQPDRAARRYHAALWHLPSDHPDRPQVLSALLDTLLRSGDYVLLGAVAAEYARAIDSRELAVAAVVAALHTSTPMPRGVRAALVDQHEALAAHDRWFAGGTIDVAELLAVGSAAPIAPAPIESRKNTGVAAMADVAALLEQRAGARIPRHGPLAQYHRVVTGYAQGRWEAALSAARQLTTTRSAAGPATPVHQLGSMVAAEICSATGDFKQAQAWLESVGEDCRFTAMRGWVEVGALAAKGETARALADGWWAYHRAAVDETPIGAERLLMRLASISVSSGHTDWGAKVLDEMADLHEVIPTQASRVALEFIRGIVTGDEASLQASADLARRSKHIPDLLGVYLALAEVSADPQPWLQNAHDLAQCIPSTPLRARTKALMRDNDVILPRLDGDRTTLTDTEQRVVDLIQQGRTNRQIAVSLSVTEKAVEYYLSRLFVKTGCRSRVDLAAASLRGRLTA